MLGTAALALLLLAAVSVDAESEALGGSTGSSSSGNDAKPERKKKASGLFEAEEKGKGKGKRKRKEKKGKKKRKGKGKGKGGSSHAKPPMPPADGCPCFTASDIDDYWFMYKSHYMGEDPCDGVEYENGRKEWFIVFTTAPEDSSEDAEEGFEFFVEDDGDVGVCEVSKYFYPSVGEAKVDRSFAGMDFDITDEGVDMVEQCIDEIKHSSMYQMCIDE